MCIDANAMNSEGLGHLCKDEHKKPNAVMKKIVAAKVSLCLFALRDIDQGVEIRYDYGPDIGSKMFWRYSNNNDQDDSRLPQWVL